MGIYHWKGINEVYETMMFVGLLGHQNLVKKSINLNHPSTSPNEGMKDIQLS